MPFICLSKCLVMSPSRQVGIWSGAGASRGEEDGSDARVQLDREIKRGGGGGEGGGGLAVRAR